VNRHLAPWFLMLPVLFASIAWSQAAPYQHAAWPSRIGVHRNPAGAAAPLSGPELSREITTPSTALNFGRIDFPRSPSGTAYGLNAKGDVVGVYGPISPIGYFASYGYVLLGNTYRDFDYPGAVASGPLAINSRRQIVGYYDPNGDENFHAYLYAAGKFTNIDYPGSVGGAGYGINDSGSIVGIYYDSVGLQHGFLLVKGKYTTLDPPGSVSPEPLSINSAGTVVGDYYDAAEQIHGFSYQDGVYTTIDYPGAAGTILSSINDAGQIVGGYGANLMVGNELWRTPNLFLLDQGQFTPLALPVDNAQVSIAYAFNGETFVGFYVDSLDNLYGYQATLSSALNSGGAY
jgi:hypothetical protein